MLAATRLEDDLNAVLLVSQEVQEGKVGFCVISQGYEAAVLLNLSYDPTRHSGRSVRSENGREHLAIITEEERCWLFQIAQRIARIQNYQLSSPTLKLEDALIVIFAR